MKRIIGLFLAVFLLLVAAAPVLAWSGCRRCLREESGYALARTFCLNPTEPVETEAMAESSDGNATAVAVSVVIVNDDAAHVFNRATAISRTR